jgi:hypothetical protein
VAERSEWARWWKQRGEEELRLILWAAWDPIGGVPRDEYETYAPQIASRLRAGANPDEIAAFLGQIRTESIGMPPDAVADQTVAYKIQDWYEPPGFSERYPSPAAFRT